MQACCVHSWQRQLVEHGSRRLTPLAGPMADWCVWRQRGICHRVGWGPAGTCHGCTVFLLGKTSPRGSIRRAFQQGVLCATLQGLQLWTQCLQLMASLVDLSWLQAMLLQLPGPLGALTASAHAMLVGTTSSPAYQW